MLVRIFYKFRLFSKPLFARRPLPEPHKPTSSVDLRVTSSGGMAMYVMLTTLAAGRFSDNAFMLSSIEGAAAGGGSGFSRMVSFVPFGDLDLGGLENSLRVEHAVGGH